MKIHEWVTEAAKELAGVGIGTAKLDAELILSHTLRKSRTWLHAYRDEKIADRHREIADARLQLRLDRVPLAYITGHKEFYGRRFDVTPSVLVPRPESETIIELLKELLPSTRALPGHSTRVVDVGTGSGCIGITLKLEHPELDVTLSDNSRYALAVAEKNAKKLGADVAILRSDLLTNYGPEPAIVVANLPYVNPEWERSPETNHEPAEALFANQNGLSLIYQLIEQAELRQPKGGLLLLEADPVQHEEIVQYGSVHGFIHVATQDYAVVLKHR
jgi:release factor glutamine methyltransferase